MDWQKSVVRNFSKLFTGYSFSRVFWFCFLIFLARKLGPTEFGIFSFALTFANLFVIFMELGINQLSIRKLARNKKEIPLHFESVFPLKIGLSLVVFFAIYVIISTLNKPPHTVLAVYLAAGFTIFTAFSNFIRSYFRALEVFQYEANSMILEKVILVSLGTGGLLLGLGLIEILQLLVLGNVLTFAAILLWSVKEKLVPLALKPNWAYSKNILRNALPFAIMDFFILIYFRIDTVMLSLMKDDAAVGLYNSAYRVLETIMVLPMLLMATAYPLMSQHASSPKLHAMAQQLMRFFLIVSLPIVIGTALMSDHVIQTLYGSGYGMAAPALQILVFAYPFICLTFEFGALLAATDKQAYATVSTGICAGLNIILNFLLIPWLSYVGAAITTAATEALLAVLLVYHCRSHIRGFFDFSFGRTIAIVNITFGAALFGCRLADLTFVLIVLLAVPLLLLLMVASGLLNRENFGLIFDKA